MFLIYEHMREVINHSTYIHLLNIIKSILTQTLEKLCKKRVYGMKTLPTYISKTLGVQRMELQGNLYITRF